jgi:hypothetical protein
MIMERQIRVLEEKVEQLTKKIGLLEDVHAIRRLHHIYGYYIDKCLYNETVELFADDCEVHFMGGIFKGKAGARRLYIETFQKQFTNGHNGPVYGFLLDHLQMQDVVDVAPDGLTAKARFRCFMQAGRHELATNGPSHVPAQWWEGGLYENEYVKENGVWKIKVLNYRGLWHADFETGWAHTPPNKYPFFSTTFPENPAGPDALITHPKPVLWPDTDVLPFHYPHPVTGEQWKE